MKREIKFRMWDIDNEYMHQNVQDGLAATKGGVPIIGTTLGTLAKDRGNYLMQFTGLTDKNGVEIYEGDVIKFNYKMGGEVFGEIIWSKGGYYVVKTDDEKWNQKVIPYPIVEIEIIGNIHENPNLIKD